jgi:hypothetical protein
MKFLSFARFFGNQWRGSRPSHKASRLARRRGARTLWLEQLEGRVVPTNDTPFVVSVTPTDLAQVANNNHPTIQIVFSEAMVAGTITNTANYVLLDREGDIIPINSATITDVPNNTTVTLAYNNGVDLTSDTYSLYIRGDKMLDADDGRSVTPKGEVVAANSTSGLMSVANFNNDGTLASTGFYPTPVLNPGNIQAFPTQVVSADFSGTGIPDLAVVAPGYSQVLIYRGRKAADGGGYDFTPTLKLNIPAGGSFTDALIAVDLNHDGKPDLAMANTNGNEVSVWLNSSPTVGAIRFAAVTNYAAGMAPVAIAAAAPTGFLPGGFLNNGNVDLVVANGLPTAPTNGNWTVNYLPSNGNGTFKATVAITVGPGTAMNPLLVGPTAVAVADFTGDFLPDILVGGSNGTILVKNTSANGTISFTVNPTLSSTAGVNSLAVGDIRGTGVTDAVATLNSFFPTVEVLLNNAPGATTFTFNTLDISVPAGVGGQILLQDINGDGKPDILVANGATPGQVTLLENTSSGGTASFTPFPGSPTSTGSPVPSDATPLGIALADTNQDGKLDLLIANETGQDYTVLLGNGDGTFRTNQNYNGTGTGLSGIAVGDINGDGIPDVVTINNTNSTSASKVFVYLGNANGSYQAPVPFSPGAGLRSLDSVTLADVNGDGKLDIVVADQQDATVGILINRTPTGGALAFTPVAPVTVGAGPVQVVAADFNGDGRQDLAVAHNGTGGAAAQHGVTILRNIGNDANGLPQFFAGFEAVTGVPAGGIAIADFNHDGLPDFVVTENRAPGSLDLFLNTSAGGGIGFKNGGNFATGIVNPGPVAVGDFNGDGFLDVAVASTSVSDTAGGVAVLLSQLGFGFGAPTINPVLPGTALNGIAVSDINLDGLPDIIVSVLPGTGRMSRDNLYVIMGDRASGLGALTPYDAGSGPSQDAPTFVATTPSPLTRLTTFDIVGAKIINVNLANNGNFEQHDLSGETGNIVGWQTFDLPSNPGGSHGRWNIQSGTNSPSGFFTVTGPTSGNFQAMLDEPIVNQVSGTVADFSGTHALYQDLILPANASKISLSLDLNIDNTGSSFSAVTVGGWTDTTTTTTLDYRIIAPNQQVRIDLMDPTAPGFDLLGTTAAQGVLKTEFITRADSPSTFVETLTDDLTAFAGKTIRLRIASANNQGELIIGIDNVQVISKFANNTAPVLQNVRLSSPGFLGSPDGKTPHTSDSTVAGQVSANGGITNIAYIAFDPTGTGFTSPLVRKIGPDSVDALGNFSYTIPDLPPGLVNVGVQVVDRAGNKTSTTITFYFQGMQSTSSFSAGGPTATNTTADPTVSYKQVSGRITATVVDSTDPTGNTYLVGTPNGGIWRTTDGGANWVPETNLVTDGRGNAILTPIGALAQSKSNPRVWYAGLGVADLQPDSLPGSGVLKSTDGGVTWTLVGNSAAALAGARISALVIDGNNPNTVYVGVASGGSSGPGVYKSTDGGATWKNVLTTAVMFTQNFGAPAFPATNPPPLASVTSLVIDPFNSNRLIVGLGNIGLVAASPVTTGVWRTTNFGGTWDNIIGGDNPAVLADTIPSGLTSGVGITIGRITIAMGSGRVGDEANIYFLFDSPPAANGLVAPNYNVGSFTGLFKTKDNLLNFTKVMLREDVFNTSNNAKPAKTPPHNYVDISLNFNEGSNFNTLLVDPNDPAVVYVGGSSRYNVPFFQDNVQVNTPTHAFIRVDTSDMWDTTVGDPVTGQIKNNGDDITKATISEIPFHLPGAPDGTNGFYDPTTNSDPYTGEGVYWYDLIEGQQNGTGAANNLPDAITSLAFDEKGRLVVGTVGGVYRGTGGAFGYDFTSGGPGIAALDGFATYAAPGMTFTSINGNLQISDLTSVSIDPTHPGTIYSTQYDTGSSITRVAGPLQWATGNTEGGFGSPFAGTPTPKGPGLVVFPATGFFSIDSFPFSYGYPTSGTVRAAPPNPGSPPDSQTVLFRVWQFATNAFINSNLEYVPEISLDSGTTWQPLFDAGVNQTGNQGGFFPALAVSPTSVFDNGIFEDVVLLGTNRVYLTRTTTNVWDPISPVLSKRNGGVGTISAVSFTAQNGAYYAGTDQGEVFFTANNGADLWPERDAGLPHAKVNAIYADPTNGATAYVLFNSGNGDAVWRTTNRGQTWTKLTNGLPGAGAHNLVADHSPGLGAPGGKLYVATDAGVYFSNNNGASWQPLSSGSMPRVPATDVQFDAGQQLLAVATLGRGSFAISTAPISPIPDQSAPEDNTLPPVFFSINENGIADSKLTVSATSSNTTLIPNDGKAIVITGSGADRALLITPTMFQFGDSTITVSVSDGVNTFTRSFNVHIVFTNHQPTITAIANQVVAPGTAIGPLSFTVGDAPTETPASQLVVTAHSSNQAVVPDANITFGGSGANRTVTVTPASATTLGAAAITVAVADTNGGLTPTTFNVLFSSPVTLPFADNFNRPNNFFLGAGWVQSFGDFENINGAAQGVSVTGDATLQGVSQTNVQAQADVTLGTTGTQYGGVIARYSGPGDANMYWGGLVSISGAYSAVIYRNVGGTWTNLTTVALPSFTGTGTVLFDVVGPSLKLFLNGALVAFTTDTLLQGPGGVGMRTSKGVILDNFSANTIALNTVTLPFNDNFNRANGELGPNWLDQLGDSHVVNNQLTTSVIDPTSPDSNKQLAISTLNGVSNADVQVQADVSLPTLSAAGAVYSGLVARYTGPIDQNMYWGGLVGIFDTTTKTTSFQAVIYRNVGGVWTQLNASTPVTLASQTNTLTFQVVGPSLKLFMNSALVAFANDTVLTAPGTVGLRSGNGVVIDNFAASVLTLTNNTLPFNDNFNRANGELGPNWLDRVGESSVVGNQVVTRPVDPSSSDPEKNQVVVSTVNGVSNTNVVLQADFTLPATGTPYSGLVARYSGVGDQNMYWGGLARFSGAYQAFIYRNLNGVWTQINAITPLALSSSTNTLRFEVVGPSLKLFVNGTLAAFANDTSLTGPGTVGLRSGFSVTIDNFSANVLTLTNNTLPFSDNFNRANGELGSNWLDQQGESSVVGNQVVTRPVDPTSSDPEKNQVVLSTVNGVSNTNVAVQADLTLPSTGTPYSGLVARHTGPGDTNMYWGGLYGANGAFQAIIYRNVNGVWTQINPVTPITLTSNTNTVRFEVVGPSLKLFVNGTLAAFANDTALTGPGTVGLRSGFSVTIDNFAASVITLNNVSAPFNDNFNRADGELGLNWVDQLGETEVKGNQAVSRVVDPNGNTLDKLYAISTLNGLNAADVTVQADVSLAATGVNTAGVVARYGGPGNNNMYWGALYANNGVFQVVLYVSVNGNWTQLAAATVSSGTGTLQLKVQGTSLKLTYGATTLNATDGQLTTGTVGFRGGNGATYDNFSVTSP